MNERLTRRVAALEAKDTPAEALPTWVQIIVGRGDTVEAAKARYVAEHPEMPPPTHWIVRKIVYPDQGEACHV
jgi:hypothetical protein